MNLKDYLRNIYLTFDYIFWSIFDFSKFKKINKETIKKVVIIHSGAIGELLSTTPIPKALKKNLGCEVYYMIRSENFSVFKFNKNVDGLIPFSLNFSENVLNLKNKNFDLAMILWPGSINISFACLISGIRYRVGCFKRVKEGPAFFYTRRWWPLRLLKQHVIISITDMLKLIGIEENKPVIEFFYSKEDLKKVKRLLHKNNVGKFVIIHPGFGGKNKLKAYSRYWPKQFYSNIIDFICKKWNYCIIISGISEEKETAESIIKMCKFKNKVINSCGIFNLQELGALVKKAELVIAPDTSIIHISSSFNTKVIDLIGDSDPIMWHPWMNKNRYELIRHPYFDKNPFIPRKIKDSDFAEKEEIVKKAINKIL